MQYCSDDQSNYEEVTPSRFFEIVRLRLTKFEHILEGRQLYALLVSSTFGFVSINILDRIE